MSWIKLFHEDVRLDPSILLQKILRCHKEHLAAWRVFPRLQKKVPATSFLLGNFHRMTFDVAIHPHFSIGAAVLFHLNGDILQAWTQQSFATDPLIGEAEAALLALSKGYDLKLQNLILQADSAIVIESLLSSQWAGSTIGSVVPWKIAMLILINSPSSILNNIPLLSKPLLTLPN